MLGKMTITARNNIFKGGMVLAALSLSVIAAGAYYAYSAYPVAAQSAAMRSRGLIQMLIITLSESSAYVPFYTMLGAAAYSFISIFLIHYFFEKTQSPEILFFGFFVISLSFESARLIIPLKMIFPLPSIYLMTCSRLLIFGRYFGLFSLFAASIYAAGLNTQKQQNAFFILILSALVIALNVPVDSLVWDSTYMPLSGYRSMFEFVEAGILAVTILTFFISAYTRGSRRYIHIGIGTFLVFTGKNIFLNSDTWITPIPGLLLLAVGTWFVSSRLHREYLWF